MPAGSPIQRSMPSAGHVHASLIDTPDRWVAGHGRPSLTRPKAPEADPTSQHHWAGIDNWMGIPWAAPDAVRAGAAVGVGVAAGLLALAAGLAGKALRGKAPHSLDHPLRT